MSEDIHEPLFIQFNGIERPTLEAIVHQLSDEQMEVLCAGSGDIQVIGEITKMLPEGVGIVQFTEAMSELLAAVVSELGSTAWGREVARLVYVTRDALDDELAGLE